MRNLKQPPTGLASPNGHSPTYTVPQTPLPAFLWHQVAGIPPTAAPDEDILISLSPLSPDLAFRDGLPASTQATHIIRTATSDKWTDNYDPGNPGVLFPCSLLECPRDSRHFYAVVWSHVVGAGFSNMHLRAYVLRLPNNRVGGVPLFEGYI
jgi:hypothetical protein